ncbi:hypothetical protein C4E24_08320 [ANME-1 cluster archaeon AG-394-G21]|nr:hypothetical protein [ANME-1 cluster archaeon AG-394-G21]
MQSVLIRNWTSYYLNRAIVAFANSGGGHIIVGVDNDGKVRYSR